MGSVIAPWVLLTEDLAVHTEVLLQGLLAIREIVVVATAKGIATDHTHFPLGLAIVALQGRGVDHGAALVAFTGAKALGRVVVLLGDLQDPVGDPLLLVLWDQRLGGQIQVGWGGNVGDLVGLGIHFLVAGVRVLDCLVDVQVAREEHEGVALHSDLLTGLARLEVNLVESDDVRVSEERDPDPGHQLEGSSLLHQLILQIDQMRHLKVLVEGIIGLIIRLASLLELLDQREEKQEVVMNILRLAILENP